MTSEMGPTRRELELQARYLAAARDFSKRNLTLLGAAKYYRVPYEDLYKKTIMKYQQVRPYSDELHKKAFYILIRTLGSKIITLPLMDKEIMQALNDVAKKLNIDVQPLWIVYNYERVILKNYSIDINAVLDFLRAKKKSSDKDTCGGCLLKTMRVEIYKYLKKRNLSFPQGWNIHKCSGLLWFLGFQATFKYEIRKNFPHKCISPYGGHFINLL